MLKIFLSDAVEEEVAFHIGKAVEPWLALCESLITRLDGHQDSRVVQRDKDKTGKDVRTSQIPPAFSNGISQSCASNKQSASPWAFISCYKSLCQPPGAMGRC